VWSCSICKPFQLCRHHRWLRSVHLFIVTRRQFFCWLHNNCYITLSRAAYCWRRLPLDWRSRPRAKRTSTYVLTVPVHVRSELLTLPRALFTIYRPSFQLLKEKRTPWKIISRMHSSLWCVRNFRKCLRKISESPRGRSHPRAHRFQWHVRFDAAAVSQKTRASTYEVSMYAHTC
jgi:hypothetical protein